MIDLKNVMVRITELEEELKSTRDGYEEEMTILVEKNDDLTRTPMIAMMTMLMKLEQISWSLPPINFSSRPPYQ